MAPGRVLLVACLAFGVALGAPALPSALGGRSDSPVERSSGLQANGPYSNKTVVNVGSTLSKRATVEDFLKYMPVVNVRIGSPPQEMKLLVDTSTINTAIPIAPTPHDNTASPYPRFDTSASTSYVTDQTVWTGSYGPAGRGVASGWLAYDKFDIDGWEVPKQGFLSATRFNGLVQNGYWSGILGLGYQDGKQWRSVLTFLENLRSQGNLGMGYRLFTLSPTLPAQEGQPSTTLQFGTVDSERYYPPLVYFPIHLRERSVWNVMSDGFFLDNELVAGPFLVTFNTGSVTSWASPAVMADLKKALFKNGRGPTRVLEGSRITYLFTHGIKKGSLKIGFRGSKFTLNPEALDMSEDGEEAGGQSKPHRLGIFEDPSFGPSHTTPTVREVTLGMAMLKDYFMVFDGSRNRVGLAVAKVTDPEAPGVLDATVDIGGCGGQQECSIM